VASAQLACGGAYAAVRSTPAVVCSAQCRIVAGGARHGGARHGGAAYAWAGAAEIMHLLLPSARGVRGGGLRAARCVLLAARGGVIQLCQRTRARMAAVACRTQTPACCFPAPCSRGSFAVVKVGVCLKTGERVALKVRAQCCRRGHP